MEDQVFEVNCGFFDSINKDRLYSADEMNRPYRRVITNGVFATPQGTASNDLQVLSANNGMNIIVKKGEGLFADKWFENAADIPITVPSNNGIVGRIDSIIVQVDKRQSGRKGNIVYRCGTPNSSPVAPGINSIDSVVEYRIASIFVSPGANYIGQDVISDLRGSSECPWVTSLIQQVDISSLFLQWQAAYKMYYDESTEDFEEYKEAQRAAWQQFLDNLTSDLSVSTNVIMLSSNYLSNTTVSSIPIGISSFNPETDVLMVFINGLRATEGVNYTINANGNSIDLKVELISGQSVNFLVLKSIIAADIQTSITMIQALDNKVSNFMQDSGWITLNLQNEITSFDNTTTPSIRCVGDRIYIRGTIKGADVGETICSIPILYVPTMKHLYTSAIISENQVIGTAVIEIDVEGNLKIKASSGTINSIDEISIETCFVLN